MDHEKDIHCSKHHVSIAGKEHLVRSSSKTCKNLRHDLLMPMLC